MSSLELCPRDMKGCHSPCPEGALSLFWEPAHTLVSWGVPQSLAACEAGCTRPHSSHSSLQPLEQLEPQPVQGWGVSSAASDSSGFL